MRKAAREGRLFCASTKRVSQPGKDGTMVVQILRLRRRELLYSRLSTDRPAIDHINGKSRVKEHLPLVFEADEMCIEKCVEMGDNVIPLLPSSRSSFEESFHGLMWLAISSLGSRIRVTRQRGSRSMTRFRNKPCPTRAFVSCSRWVSGIAGSASI